MLEWEYVSEISKKRYDFYGKYRNKQEISGSAF